MPVPHLYKIVLKPATEARDEFVSYCIDNNLLALGWGADHFPRPLVPRDFDHYYQQARKVWSEHQLTPVRQFHDAPRGSLIWFRDLQGRYHLARLTGKWRPRKGARWKRLDLGQVRAVKSHPVGSEAEVPGAVIRAFAAPRQWAFCRVGDDEARKYSAQLAHQLLGGKDPEIEITPSSVLHSLLGPLDVEDLVAAYLQANRDYIALPARHSKTTAVYEYILRSREDGHLAAVQVKTGDVPIPDNLSDNVAEKWFVYSDAPEPALKLPSFVERITPDQLIAFMSSGSNCLPPVTQRWMDWANGEAKAHRPSRTTVAK